MVNIRSKYVRKFIITEEKDNIRVFLNSHFRQLVLTSIFSVFTLQMEIKNLTSSKL